MTSTFEKDTHPRRLDVDPARYEMILDPSWWVGRGPNGGYVAAGMMRALEDRLEGTGPLRDLNVSFLEAADAGPAEIVVKTIRDGGSVTVARANLVQDGTVAVTLRATMGATGDGPSFVADDAPQAAPWAKARPFDPAENVDPPAFVQHCEFRLAGGSAPLQGEIGDDMRIWMRMVEPTSMDEALLTFLGDAWMPALFGVVDRQLFAPSLDYTLQVHELPEDHGDDEPLLGVFRAEHARDGYAFEDGTLWTQDGDLVARARQTRRVLS